MQAIRDLFESYYFLLALILAVMIPVWFGRFVFEAVATIIARRRSRACADSPKRAARQPRDRRRSR